MKLSNILKTLAVAAAGALLWSCQQKELETEARAVASSETYVTFASTGAQAQVLSVYADGVWNVDVDADWISVTPMTGNGHGEITISVRDNSTGGTIDRPRDGKITIQGKYASRQSIVSVHQDGDTYYGVTTYKLSQIASLEDGAVGKVHGAQVIALTGSGFVLQDESGYLYATGENVKLGDVLSFNGSKTTLFGGPAFETDEVTVLSNSEVKYADAPDMTSQIGEYKGGVVYALLKGSLVNGVLKVGKANVQLLDPVESLELGAVDLHKVSVTGFVVGISGATGYMVATKVEDEGADETLVPYPLRWAMGKDLNYSNATWNNDSPRAEPIQGIGYIEYVPYDLEGTNSGGNFKLDVQANNLRVTGPYVNDYWLFYGNGAIPANTEVQIAFEMRSSAWGQKFWVLEYLDGEEWLTAPNVKYSDEPGVEVPYHIATNPDGATNSQLMEVIKFRKNNEHLQIRMRCSVNWRGGGQPMANPRTTASSRLTVTNVDDDTYKPNIQIIKEGNGVEKDPVYANIETSTDLLTFNGTPGDPKELTITSDYDFTVSTSADWLSLDPTEGVAGEPLVVKVTCEESQLAELRQGVIRIVSEDSEKVVNVVQSAAGQILDPFISISGGNAITVGSEAGKTIVKVQTNAEFEFVSNDSWISVAPLQTKSLVDWFEYELTYEENTAEQTPRSGSVRFFNTEKKLETILTVTQEGAPASDVYFQDDFEWLAPWSDSAPDDVSDNKVGTAQNMFTTAALAPALEEFQKRGYGYVWGWQGQDWSDGLPDNGNKQTLYLMKNYLKFGKTSYNSGIILPPLAKMAGTDNVDLTFDWAWCMTGASKPDVMTLTVTVTGGGYLADTKTETSGEITSSQPTEGDQTVLEWQHAKVTIVGATPATRITIRPTNADPSISSSRKQNRWYLDNIKVEKSDYQESKREFYADDFEWLAPWSASAPDDVTDNKVGTAQNMFTTAALAPALEEFQKRGYGYVWGWQGQDWSDGLPDNGNKQTLYLMKNYLKFGKTSYNSGIILPKIPGITAATDVELSFDWCWCMTGASKPDLMTLTVTVEGGGTIQATGTTVSGEITSSQPTEGDLTVLEWQHASVKIVGATADTRITIRPTNADPSITSSRKQNRWYLDNIKVTE